MKEDVKVFLDVVMQNPRGLYGVSNRDVAEKALIWCLDHGLSTSGLLARVIHANHPEYLFSLLCTKLKDSNKRFELLDAVIRVPQRVWDDAILNAQSVGEIFSGAEDFSHILKYHKDRFLNFERPEFAKCFSSDQFWLHRVRWYIAKGDFRRAWDELKRAWRGFFVGPKDTSVWLRGIRPNWYYYAASKKVLAQLVHELYHGMLDKQIIDPITEDDHALRTAKQKVHVYGIRVREVAAVHVHTRTVIVAGIDFARLFRRTEQPYDVTKPLVLADEGAMILKIAEYWRQQRNAQRRRQCETKLTRLAQER